MTERLRPKPAQWPSAISELGPENMEELVHLCSGPSSPSRQVLTAIREMSPQDHLPFLLNLMDCGQPDFVWHAAMAIGHRGNNKATMPLLDFLRRSDNLDSRRDVIYALRCLQDPRAVSDLLRILGDQREHPILRDWAAEALSVFIKKLRDRIVPALIEALNDPFPGVRWTAAWALAQSGDKRAIPALQARLGDKDAPPGNTTVGEEAREALARLRSKLLRRPSGGRMGPCGRFGSRAGIP